MTRMFLMVGFSAKDGVDVIAGGVNVIHRGLEPEEKIVEAMASMLALAEDEGLPVAVCGVGIALSVRIRSPVL